MEKTTVSLYFLPGRLMSNKRFILTLLKLSVTGLLFLTFPVRGQNVYFKKMGEINRIDTVSKTVEVIIFDKNDLDNIKNNEQLVVYDHDNTLIMKLTITSYNELPNRVLVECQGIHGIQKLFVGEAVGVQHHHKNQQILYENSKVTEELPKEMINSTDSSTMVLIPKGPFIFGSDIPGTLHYTTPIEYNLSKIQEERGEKRIRYIDLDAFYIDRFEISVEQFKKYLLETGLNPPPQWNPHADPGLPVANLSYEQAESYCKWAGKRLPSELEWEKAARGPGVLFSYDYNDQTVYREKINVYPTGLEFNSKVCVTADTTHQLENVYRLRDKNYYGLYGVCGNAAEWTSSWLLPYRGNSIKNQKYGRKFKVIRGGAYNLPSKWTKTYERMIGGIPSLESDYRAGVRCARNVNF